LANEKRLRRKAIKMITDFKDAIATVEEQEYLLKVVEDYRK
jgi:hypothetical protein